MASSLHNHFSKKEEKIISFQVFFGKKRKKVERVNGLRPSESVHEISSTDHTYAVFCVSLTRSLVGFPSTWAFLRVPHARWRCAPPTAPASDCADPWLWNGSTKKDIEMRTHTKKGNKQGEEGGRSKINKLDDIWMRRFRSGCNYYSTVPLRKKAVVGQVTGRV